MNKLPHGVKGFLFDLDGTLVDAKSWHMMALADAIEAYGYHITLDDLKVYHGTTSIFALEQLESIGRAPDKKFHQAIYEDKKRRVQQIINEERL